MNEVSFVKRRESDWQRLTHLCDAADVSPARLKPEEFHEFIRLYRRVSADLSLARTKSNNIQLINFLNDIVARAYGVLYRSPRRSFLKTLGDAVETAATTARRCKWYIATSTLVFLASIFFAFTMIRIQPETKSTFVPGEWEEVVEGWKKGEFEERTAGQSAQMTGFYMYNNPRQAVISGAVAASTFGIGTAGILYMNGALLGALAYEVDSVGKLGFLLVSISPHGVTEISGLVISSAAGLVMGYALINPGRRRRGAALRAAGKDALVLLITGTMMMFIAAPIEGFFSFNPNVPPAAKIAFALTSAVAWAMFWLLLGRNKDASTTVSGIEATS